MIGPRIAIRDNTDSHNIDFFDNNSGIKYHYSELKRYLKGSCAVLSLKYYSQDIETVSVGNRLSFIFKNNHYWMTINSIKKDGFEVELTAYDLNLEANKETAPPFKASKAMTIADYLSIFDAEKTFQILNNDFIEQKKVLEWTGTDTVLGRIYSLADQFGGVVSFKTELNNDYSLNKHYISFIKDGNFGEDRRSEPIRIGSELDLVKYSANINNIYSAVTATGSNGITIDGINRTVYDDNRNILYKTNGPMLLAPQTRDNFPSSNKISPDRYILKNLGQTNHQTKESLYQYLLTELKKNSQPMITYEAKGTIEASPGDKVTLIDDLHYSPPLYVEATVTETTESLTESLKEVIFDNFEKKNNQIDSLIMQKLNNLIIESMPYNIEISTTNGTAFKNNIGSSEITPSLYQNGQLIQNVIWQFTENGWTETADKYSVEAKAFKSTTTVIVKAFVKGSEVSSKEISFVNVNDGVGGEQEGVNLLESSNFITNNHQMLSSTTRTTEGTGNYYIGWAVGFKPNKTYTFSFNMLQNSGQITPYLSIYSQNLQTRKLGPVTIDHGKATFTTNSNVEVGDYLLVYLTHETPINYTLEKIKLEEGNVATEWTINPYELSEQVAEATTNSQKAVIESENVKEQIKNKLDESAITLNGNGTVTKSGVNVTGETYANMIASNPNWAQKIGEKIKIKGDMIVDGSISSDKINATNLSAINSNLGRITAGEFFITNEVLNPKNQRIIQQFTMEGGTIKFIMINTADYSVEETHLNGEEVAIIKKNNANEIIKQVLINDERIQIFGKGAEGINRSLELGFENGYTRLRADYIENNSIIKQTVILPHGIRGDMIRVGNNVTINIQRTITSLQTGENIPMLETIPKGYRPYSDINFNIILNSGQNVKGVAILHINKNGKISMTNGISGGHVITGTISWVTVEPVPVLDFIDL